MTAREMKIPAPGYITIESNPARVVVTLGDQAIADSRQALTLSEGSHSPALYIPRADVDMALLERTDHTSWCPYKGEASYYSIPSGGPGSVNAVWTYEHAFPAVAAIEGHLAFYPDRVDSIVEHPAD
jgi:uncharacterized protein (DUF427 family)